MKPFLEYYNNASAQAVQKHIRNAIHDLHNFYNKYVSDFWI